MQTFDEWIAQNYPMFELTGDMEGDTVSRLVRIVALGLFNQRADLLEAARAAEAIFARQKWTDDSNDPEAAALRKLRAAIARATGSHP